MVRSCEREGRVEVDRQESRGYEREDETDTCMERVTLVRPREGKRSR